MEEFKDIRCHLSKEHLDVQSAQHIAHVISFGPIIFEVARMMIKHDIYKMLNDSENGMTEKQIVEATKLSQYAIKCLLESSLTTGTILISAENGRYVLSKIGWFLLNDPTIRVDIDFNHDINYKGFFYLDTSLEQGIPRGLKEFGSWRTLYEGLSSFPKQAQQSWLSFDHYYSNTSFQEALDIIFKRDVKYLLDIGGNTGRFAKQCTECNNAVNVTVCDLPQQIKMMEESLLRYTFRDRINSYAINILDEKQYLPSTPRYDVIWMSQFLDCFSEEEIVRILRRVRAIMDEKNRLYIMEPLWDRQKYLPAAFALTQISLYFSVIANGNSKMYCSEDLVNLIHRADLHIEHIYDSIGKGFHSLIVCKKYKNT